MHIGPRNMDTGGPAQHRGAGNTEPRLPAGCCGLVRVMRGGSGLVAELHRQTRPLLLLKQCSEHGASEHAME